MISGQEKTPAVSEALMGGDGREGKRARGLLAQVAGKALNPSPPLLEPDFSSLINPGAVRRNLNPEAPANLAG